MKPAHFALIGAAVLTCSAASAQDLTGTVTMVDRVDHNIVIQRAQDGTVGATGGPAQWIKVRPDLSLDNVHAGDKVAYVITDTGGAKTITKLEKQKD